MLPFACCDIVLQAVVSSGRSIDIIVGVDTVVESAGVILEKPDDAQHALRMLQSLNGGRHAVHTGVALKFMDGSSHCFHETTLIDFAAVSTEERRFLSAHALCCKVTCLFRYFKRMSPPERFATAVIVVITVFVFLLLCHLHHPISYFRQPMDKAGGFGIQGIFCFAFAATSRPPYHLLLQGPRQHSYQAFTAATTTSWDCRSTNFAQR